MQTVTTHTRVVIFRPGALGDTLTLAPVLWALKAKHPEWTVWHLAEQPRFTHVVNAMEVATLIPEISQTILYDTRASFLGRLLKLRTALRPHKEDILLNLCYPRANSLKVLRDAAFFKGLGFRKLVGFREAFRDSLKSRRVGLPSESEYNRLLRHSRSLTGSAQGEPQGQLRQDSEFALEFCRKHGLTDCKLIALCAGSKMQAKRWPPERYAEMVAELSKELGVTFIILGDRFDLESTALIQSKAPDACLSALGASLLQSAGLLARCKLYVGNDTGTMHLAGLLRVPCVTLFSDRDHYSLWVPYGDQHTIIRYSMPCGGCLLENCFASPALCLDAISVREVVTAVRETWSRLVKRDG